MNTMNFKGYTARVEYDERDNILVGRLLGIRSIISFHADTVAALRSEFEAAVNDYLADCEVQGQTFTAGHWWLRKLPAKA
jgi:predicted HicB family RNase H-like nuclease